jgi:hypothetical protein
MLEYVKDRGAQEQVNVSSKSGVAEVFVRGALSQWHVQHGSWGKC